MNMYRPIIASIEDGARDGMGHMPSCGFMRYRQRTGKSERPPARDIELGTWLLSDGQGKQTARIKNRAVIRRRGGNAYFFRGRLSRRRLLVRLTGGVGNDTGLVGVEGLVRVGEVRRDRGRRF